MAPKAASSSSAAKSTTPTKSGATTPTKTAATTADPDTPSLLTAAKEKKYDKTLTKKEADDLATLQQRVAAAFPNNPQARVVKGIQTEIDYAFVRVYENQTNVLAFIHAVVLSQAITETKKQLDAVLKVRGGGTLTEAEAKSDSYLRLCAKLRETDKNGVLKWTVHAVDETIKHKFELTCTKTLAGGKSKAIAHTGQVTGLSKAIEGALNALA